MTIEILRRPTRRARLAALAEGQFGDMVKAVVDVERGVMAIGGGLHSDEKAGLFDAGGGRGHFWGINFFPGGGGDGWVGFDSLFNVRPSQGNRSRKVGGS